MATQIPARAVIAPSYSSRRPVGELVDDAVGILDLEEALTPGLRLERRRDRDALGDQALVLGVGVRDDEDDQRALPRASGVRRGPEARQAGAEEHEVEADIV